MTVAKTKSRQAMKTDSSLNVWHEWRGGFFFFVNLRVFVPPLPFFLTQFNQSAPAPIHTKISSTPADGARQNNYRHEREARLHRVPWKRWLTRDENSCFLLRIPISNSFHQGMKLKNMKRKIGDQPLRMPKFFLLLFFGRVWLEKTKKQPQHRGCILSVGIGRVIILDILLTIPMLVVQCSCYYFPPLFFFFAWGQIYNTIIASAASCEGAAGGRRHSARRVGAVESREAEAVVARRRRQDEQRQNGAPGERKVPFGLISGGELISSRMWIN